ncbi:unnamed protein product, partial [Ranitomeya imitator]
MVFQVLRANSLFVKGSKCLFGVQKVSFLGFIFSPSTIEMDPVKVQAIYDWTQPTSVKSLQKFLGFANFYRCFIANFSSVAKPLTDLTKKGADVVNWSSAAVEAFQELKRRFSSAPVLCQPDVSLPFQVEVDASEIGAGAVLSQRNSDGSVMKPCPEEALDAYFYGFYFRSPRLSKDVGRCCGDTLAPVVPSVDPPAPVLVEGELEYVVEKILDSRISRRKLQYLVKWKGYGQEDNSWVFASDVHAADLVRAFHLARPGRPGGSGVQKLTNCSEDTTVLNLGLSFCPTPKRNAFQLEKDLQQFYRNIRLKVHFENTPPHISNTLGSIPDREPSPSITIDTLGLRNPSNFIPPRSNHAVESFVDLLDRDIKQTIHAQRLGLLPIRHNLSSLEKETLKSLQDNSNIIIKAADKGGTLVVMNRSQYVGEIRRQLADTNTYKKIQSDPTFTIRRKIDNILNKHLEHKTIDSKTRTFLINQHPVTPVLYTLPKIHKDLHNPPGRPIVASTDSILNPVSVFLEKILTPYTHNTKSFILDTGDFLNKIRNLDTVSPTSILCTLDVNSLYTSIAHDKGIQAVSQSLEEANTDAGSQELCLDLLNIVLRENFFSFEDDFVQTCGTAMGSNVAPAYANLYMDRFERDHIYSNPLFQQHAITWFRYIDDIFCIWLGDFSSLSTFFNTLNSVREELKFTLSHDSDTITFLDTRIRKDSQGKLTTDIYTKPTDCNNLLRYDSCHPKSTRDSLPRSQFKRVTRIVSDSAIRESRLQEMSDRFKSRNYPSTLLATEMTRALADTETNIPTTKPPRLPFVHDHHPSMKKVHNLIHKHWPLLTKAYPNITTFKNPPLMCLRRPQNIKDRVVRADLRHDNKTSTRTLTGLGRTGTFPCLNYPLKSRLSQSLHPSSGA